MYRKVNRFALVVGAACFGALVHVSAASAQEEGAQTQPAQANPPLVQQPTAQKQKAQPETVLNDDLCDTAVKANSELLAACLTYYTNKAALSSSRAAATNGEAQEWAAQKELRANQFAANQARLKLNAFDTYNSRYDSGELGQLSEDQALELLGLGTPKEEKKNTYADEQLPASAEPKVDTPKPAPVVSQQREQRVWRQPRIQVMRTERDPNTGSYLALMRQQVALGSESAIRQGETLLTGQWTEPVWRTVADAFAGGTIESVDLKGIIVDYGQNRRFRYDVTSAY